MHLEWRCEYLDLKWNPHRDKTYKVRRLHHFTKLHKTLSLSLIAGSFQRVTRSILSTSLCHWRLELDDIGELLRVCGIEYVSTWYRVFSNGYMVCGLCLV